MAGIFINTDAMTFFHSGAEKMNEAGIIEDVDFYAENGGVEAICFNMNFQRCYWRSKSREAIWDGIDFQADGRLFFNGHEVRDVAPEPNLRTQSAMARLLADNCPDFFAVRYRRCHQHNCQMWHSMRMNDVHFTPDETLNQHSELWRTRRDLHRAAYREAYSGHWGNFGLDYSKPEVRLHNMALVREYLSHECDGLELDWMRSLPIFAPGFEEPGKDLLTQMMREIRDEADIAAKRFGHRVRILCRVPPTPEETLRSGLDILTWAKLGLVDIVTPSPPYSTNNALFTPLDIWRRLLPDCVTLAPCLEWQAAAFPGGPRLRASQESDAGFAATFYHRGADTIYLYNHFRNGGGFADKAKMQTTFALLADRERLAASPRRHIATYQNSENGCEGLFTRLTLPDEAWGKSVVAFRIDVGSVATDREALVVICGDVPINADTRVNTVSCNRLSETDNRLPPPPEYNEPLYVAAYEIPHGVVHDGLNTVDIINLDEKGFRPLWGEIVLL